MKIKPKDQTKALAKARLEFLKRNEKAFAEFLEQIGNEALQLWERMGMSAEEALQEIQAAPAAINGKPVFIASWMRVLSTLRPGMDYDEINDRYRKQILKDSRSILENLMFSFPYPDESLFLVADLNRSKEAIMAEIDEIVTEERNRLKKERQRDFILDDGKVTMIEKKEPDNRLKWLPIVDALLEVWDLWSEAGKTPAIQTFTLIAKKLKRPISTVKDQWYSAYEKIQGEKYSSTVKLATEEKRADADAMCAKCGKITQCYRERNGMMDFIPCKAYLRAIGIEIEREDYSEENEPLTPEDILLDKEE